MGAWYYRRFGTPAGGAGLGKPSSPPGKGGRGPGRGRGRPGRGPGGGGGSGAKLAVVSQPLAGSTGLQTVTEAGFGTPKAAFVFGHGSALASDDDMIIRRGLTDGVRDRSLSGWRQDNYTGANASRRADNGDMNCYLADGTNLYSEMHFNSWVEDGIEVNYSLAGPEARTIWALLGGDKLLNAYVNNATLAGTYSETGLGFQPNVLMCFGNFENFNGLTGAGPIINGFAVENAGGIEQRSMGHNPPARNGDTARGWIRPGVWSREGNEYVEVTSFDADGFSTQQNAATSGQHVMYLALRIDSENLAVRVIDTPTSTGVQSYTGFGFQPNQLWIAQSMMPTGGDHADNGAAFPGFSVVNDTAAGSFSFYTEHNADPSVNKSYYAASAINLEDTGGKRIEAALDSFTADGFDLNFTTADAFARKQLVLAIG